MRRCFCHFRGCGCGSDISRRRRFHNRFGSVMRRRGRSLFFDLRLRDGDACTAVGIRLLGWRVCAARNALPNQLCDWLID